MHLAFHSVHFSPRFGSDVPLSHVIAGAGAAGFRHIGLDLPAIDAWVAAGDGLEGIAERLGAAGLLCTDLVVLAITPDDDAVVAAAQRIAAVADVLGARLCVVAVPEPMPWSGIVEITRRAADILWDYGVRLAIEFVPYTALSTLRQAKDLCAGVGWERAGLLLDSLHFFRAGTAWHELRGLDADQIALLQMSDAAGTPPEDLREESRQRRLIPGEGELPLAEFAAAVRDTGFDGPVAAEVLSADLRQGEPEAVARLVRDGLLTYWPEAGSDRPRRSPTDERQTDGGIE